MKLKNSIVQYRVALTLAGVYFLAMLDRQVVAVLFDPMKEEFGLSDQQLAMISGLAFALFYSIAGVPLGRLADRVNRVNMLSICIALWSVATVATGLAGSFIQLLLARIGVGIGEGGCTPAAHSIMSDTYTPEKRSTAIGLYMAGGALGTSTAYLFGGWMVELYGWRAAIICVGLPGILFALVLKKFLTEPPRPAAPKVVANSGDGMWQVFALLLKNPIYVLVVIGHIAASGYLFVMATWLPAYVNRSFEMSFSEIGTFLFASSLIGSMGGSLLSGFITDKMFERNPKWMAGMPALCMFVAAPTVMLAFTTSALPVLFVCVSVLKGLLVGSFVPTFSIVHYIIPATQRGVAIAVKIMAVSIIAVGIFPVIVGTISDILRESYGNDSLRYGLLGFGALCPLGLLVFIYLIGLIPMQSIEEREAELANAENSATA